jgi:hypothetical protein
MTVKELIENLLDEKMEATIVVSVPVDGVDNDERDIEEINSTRNFVYLKTN